MISMTISDNYVYPSTEVSKIDNLAIKQEGIPGFVLMRRAADFSYQSAIECYPNTNSFIVFCGLGNNAGDGYLFASRALDEGKKAQVVYLSTPENLKGDAYLAYQEYEKLGGQIFPWSKDRELCADLYVDAIFGVGLNRSVDGVFLQAIQTINQSPIPVISLDIPSGLNPDTGEKMEDCISAQMTTTFVGYKKGLFLNSGPDCSGKISYSDLDIPECCFDSAKPSLRIVDKELSKNLLKKRPKTSHKGSFGHILIVGGNHGMGGAVRIASEAALRSGAGLVSVVTRAANIPIVTKLRPEIMCHSVDEDPNKINDFIAKASVVAIGPGLGLDDWAMTLFEQVFQSNLPMVVDADALNILSLKPRKRKNWILTPHPGEAARLIGITNPRVQSDRIGSLQKLADSFSGTIVLKGNNTLIGSSNEMPYLITVGNPGMASAGMGDLLTGIIAGLLGQFKDIDQGLVSAVAAYIHGSSGDLAAEQGERGLIATDLFRHLQQCLNP